MTEDDTTRSKCDFIIFAIISIVYVPIIFYITGVYRPNIAIEIVIVNFILTHTYLYVKYSRMYRNNINDNNQIHEL